MLDMTLMEMESMLENALIGRLCMADALRRPYVIPLPFCWHGGAVYVRFPMRGRKGQVLADNDQVCFEVDEFTATLDDYASVLVEGRLTAVVDLEEKARIKAINDEKYTRLRNGNRPGHGRSTPLHELPMRKILVTALTGRRKPSDASTELVNGGSHDRAS